MLGQLPAQHGRLGRAGELPVQLGQPGLHLLLPGSRLHQQPLQLPRCRVPLLNGCLRGLGRGPRGLARRRRGGHRRIGRHRRHLGHRLLAHRARRTGMQVHAQTHRQVGGLRLLVRPEGRLQLGVGPLGDHPCGGQRRHRGGMLVIRRAHRRPDRVGLAGQPIPIVVRPQLQSQRALVTGGGQLTAQLVLPLLGQRHRGRRRLGVGPRRGDRVSDSGHPSRRAHPGQHGQIVVQRGQRRRGLPCGDPGRRQLRHRLGHRGRQLGHPLHPGVGLGQRLVVHAGQPGEHLVDRLQPGLGLRGARRRLLLHVLIDAEAQQVDQDLLPRRRLGVQEVGELPLWQHHTAGELLVR
ncbi:hypothetical protein GUI43_03765 [Micromonospora noduli]|nr:hypothetical protein GUI43_03765 [Micromonospora noduli]